MLGNPDSAVQLQHVGDNFQGMMVQEYLEYVCYMLDELLSLCL
jgi:hypothetical protein